MSNYLLTVECVAEKHAEVCAYLNQMQHQWLITQKTEKIYLGSLIQFSMAILPSGRLLVGALYQSLPSQGSPKPIELPSFKS